MRGNEKFSEEFSVLSENSSAAPHSSSLVLIDQLAKTEEANTRYVTVSASYLVSKGKMRRNEKFSEEFSVVSENSSAAPHSSSSTS